MGVGYQATSILIVDLDGEQQARDIVFILFIYLIIQEWCNKTVISSCEVTDAHSLVITGFKTANMTRSNNNNT